MNYIQNSWFSGLLRRVVWWLDTSFSEDRHVEAAGLLKHYYPTAIPHGATTKKTTNFTFTAVKTSNLANMFVFLIHFHMQNRS
jgi:hypothetical protein